MKSQCQQLGQEAAGGGLEAGAKESRARRTPSSPAALAKAAGALIPLVRALLLGLLVLGLLTPPDSPRCSLGALEEGVAAGLRAHLSDPGLLALLAAVLVGGRVHLLGKPLHGAALGVAVHRRLASAARQQLGGDDRDRLHGLTSFAACAAQSKRCWTNAP